MLIIITTKESNSRTVTKQMPTPNEKPGQDLNSKIFPLQFRMLFYFCSFDFLEGGPVSSAGSTLSLRIGILSIHSMLGPEKCLNSNSLRIITQCFVVPTFLVKRMHRSFAIGTLLRKPPARTTPMDRLLISRAFLLCTHVHLVTQEFEFENASETQIDTTMTFTVLIVSIEQNEELQESRVQYTLAGIKSLLKIGERGGGGFLDARGGVPEPLEPSPGYAPVSC